MIKEIKKYQNQFLNEIMQIWLNELVLLYLSLFPHNSKLLQN